MGDRETAKPASLLTPITIPPPQTQTPQQVFQVEFAPNVVQHLHRIGRAVRAGREGRAVNFYDAGSEDLVESLREAGDDSLDRSFSRQRGFRKKIKKYGKGYYRRDGGGGGEGSGGGGGKPRREEE